MAQLPTGTVTFLFTDIAGSTRLLQQLGDRYADALMQFRQILRSAIQERGGQEVDTQGDALFAAFPSAKGALAAAVETQRAIIAHPWPDAATVRVRMGLHTGEPRTDDTGYVGLDVHRAARICAAGHGGQILLSDTTHALVVKDLLDGVSLRDLGAHRLKDLTHTLHLFQVVAEGLPTDFPPLRTLNALPNNLPRQLTSFVGREREMAGVRQLLSTTYLLTLTGSGGCGKTRLALQVAADLLEEYPDGVWLVELAALADAGLIPQTVALALGVREEPGRPLVATLEDFIRPKHLLFVLDNCEHLLLACAQLADALLRACPTLRILATSREPLGVDGELSYRVPSLALPDPRRLLSVEDLTEFEAVRLFRERAAHSRPGFAVTKDNAQTVAQVCRQLDGIPLAIELAAARVQVLSVEQIAARLNDRFRLLTGGSRTRLPRQQTLQAVMDWSYQLLSEKERTALRRLSVFAGSWTLEAAEAVCPGDGVEPNDALDLLTQLVFKSLVSTEEQEGDVRYHFLETVRQYGLHRLQESGEADRIRLRHRDFFLALAERAKPELRGKNQRMWLKRLETEHDNLRVALEWPPEGGEASLRLAAALVRFWEVRGYFGEGREHLASTLSREAAAEPTVARSEALIGAGILAWRQGDHVAARALYEEALAIGRALGDNWGIARALNSLGVIAYTRGEYAAARALYEEALVIRRELGDKAGITLALNNLGCVALEQGDYTLARALLVESLATKGDLGDTLGTAESLHHLGRIAYYQDDHAAAQELYEKSLTIKREFGDNRGIAESLIALGNVASHQGDHAAARALYEESLTMGRALGDKLCIAECLGRLAGLAGAQGQSDRAARLFGAAEALHEAVGAHLPPSDRATYDCAVAAARAGLGESVFIAALAAGRAMTLEQAVKYALTHNLPGA